MVPDLLPLAGRGEGHGVGRGEGHGVGRGVGHEAGRAGGQVESDPAAVVVLVDA